ncbi:asparagine synthase (glutamine-hydrolyzing) [bacterium]|nr:asparagine synthase (glutamine-hydrolyzing) [bacterium]
MCGICGILNTSLNGNIKEETVRSMCSVLKHRGPDDEGIYLGWGKDGRKNVGLGIRRLAIIDPDTGHQPIHNEERTIWTVCNGEIYNFRELRKDLEAKGHCFYTHSDAEVIVHLYEEYGVECLNFLRGMFALAVWDDGKKSLLLARDRIGQKPLCYAEIDNELVFASEIKSILQVKQVPRQVNIEAIHNYLTYQYVPSPITAFKGISKLPPAHYLLWENGKISIEQYWNLNAANKIRMSENEYCSRLRNLFEESVKLRLVSDVPLGAFLSGGLDSSIVVGVMSKLMSEPVKTFSIGFQEEKYNELKYARIAANHFKTDHHEYIVKPDALDILPKLIWHYNEPFADSSALPTYYVAKMTSRDVTVALNGDGGDESFAGYPRYKAVKLAKYYEKFPQSIRNMVNGIAMKLPYSTEQKTVLRRFRRFAESMNYSPERRYIRWISIFDNERKKELYASSFREAVQGIDSFGYAESYYNNNSYSDFLDRTLFVDIMTYLPGDLLVKMDIAAMANSLEARSPFLDHKFMEFAASIPPNLKLKGLSGKYILKKAFSKLVPASILKRRKMGFGVPISHWFRNELKDYLRDELLSRRCLERGYFQTKYLKLIIDEHINGRYDHGYRLWALLNLELWQQMFIDKVSDNKT